MRVAFPSPHLERRLEAVERGLDILSGVARHPLGVRCAQRIHSPRPADGVQLFAPHTQRILVAADSLVDVFGTAAQDSLRVDVAQIELSCGPVVGRAVLGPNRESGVEQPYSGLKVPTAVAVNAAPI